MKISVELDALNAAFDTISKTAAPSSGNITFSSTKGKLTVSSQADLSRCMIIVPCSVDKDGEFAVPMQAVKDAVRGREKVSMVYANTVLSISAGTYKASLATVDVIPMDELHEEESKDWKLTAEQAGWLRKALKDVALKPTTLLSPWMPAGVRLTSTGAFVACFDTQHMAWVSSKEVTGDFECLLPTDTLQSVIEVFHASNFVISQGKSLIKIRNKLTTVVLNVPSTDELPTLKQVQEKIKEAQKEKADTFAFTKADLQSFLDNSRAVLSKERAELSVEATDKGIGLSIKTVQGEVKATIKGSGKKSFKIDLEYLQELTAKAPAELELKVVANAFVSSKLTSSSIIVALNQ
jgi:hypothetical protein